MKSLAKQNILSSNTENKEGGSLNHIQYTGLILCNPKKRSHLCCTVVSVASTRQTAERERRALLMASEDIGSWSLGPLCWAEAMGRGAEVDESHSLPGQPGSKKREYRLLLAFFFFAPFYYIWAWSIHIQSVSFFLILPGRPLHSEMCLLMRLILI